MRNSTHQLITAIVFLFVVAVPAHPATKASDTIFEAGKPIQFKQDSEIDLNKGLLAYYPFTENSRDESGNERHLKLKGARWAEDRHGNENKAYQLNGSKIKLPFFESKFHKPVSTLSFWVKSREKSGSLLFLNCVPGTMYMVVRKVNHKFELEIKIQNKKIQIKDQYQYRDRSAFNFLAVAFDGKYLSFYVNNQLAGKQAIDKKLMKKFPYTLRKDPYFKCKATVDDIRVYSRVLNEMELDALYSEIYSIPELSYETHIKTAPRSADIYRTVLSDGGSEITQMGVCWNTTGNPDTTDHKTSMKGYVGMFKSTMTGLSPNTKYYVKAYAINKLGIGYSSEEFEFITLPDLDYGSVTDIEDNVYRTVTIGTQTWMAENLRTTRYADGTPLKDGTRKLNDPGKYFYNFNEDTLHREIYGLLYSWEGATNSTRGSSYTEGIQGICPDGWHIPSFAEKEYLLHYLGGPEMAATKLREAGNAHWDTPDGTNESGFSALGSGVKAMEEEMYGVFVDFRSLTYFWTSESYSHNIDGKTYIFAPVLQVDGSDSHYWSPPTDYGASVRCIMDHNNSYIKAPGVITSAVTDISSTKATGGGLIESDGGQFRTLRGICWSTKSNPDTSDFKTSVLDDRKTFTSEMKNLKPDTRYYVRAYGITSAGIGYGNQVSFTTRPVKSSSLELTDSPGIEAPEPDFYPNPASSVINFSNVTENAAITIFDSQGKILKAGILQNNQFDISSLSKGVYYIRINDDQKSVIRKLVKQ